METLYALALSHLPGISPSAALRICEHYGTAAAFFEDKEPAERKLRDTLSLRTEALHWAAEELAYCEQHHIRAISYDMEAYPQRLRECADSPLVLFFCGQADLNARHVVSVVGTRHITEYGRDLCRHFCEDLARLVPDVLVVSGLAYGVDIHAHRGALQHGLPTVGVLAHGLDRIYPAHHRDTAAKMTVCGGLLTEYPRGTTPEKGNFVRRNRIIAGLSDATVVVESAAKGGSLITAHLAQDYNRDVFTFPGRTTDAYSAGCNALVRENVASLITSAEDFALAMRWAEPAAKNGAVQRKLFPELSPEEKQIVMALADADRKTISQVVMETGLPFNRTSALLTGMELKGIVRALPGGLFRLLQ
ncbi:MAG: DNA-processing protein DprA [Alloprevotella sp.]|nr:DNA-processing protein DprA [Alloprevotella sp.]